MENKDVRQMRDEVEQFVRNMHDKPIHLIDLERLREIMDFKKEPNELAMARILESIAKQFIAIVDSNNKLLQENLRLMEENFEFRKKQNENDK